MTKPLRVILLGAGARGADAYGPYALQHPDELRFIAVAEPDPSRRRRFAEQHRIPDSMCFTTWEEVFSGEKFADAVFNCTQDQMHHPSSMAALNIGYDLLLEKPICTSLEDTISLVKTAEEKGRVLQICHVLRYTDFWIKARQIVESGVLGQIIHYSHRENVSSFHMAHSYVRGNWRNSGLSSPMLLAKCCHDLDLIYWILGARARTVTSTGNLRHFKPENAPKGAPQRCTDGCPASETCPFYAPAIYIDLEWLTNIMCTESKTLFRVAGYLYKNARGLIRLLANVIPDLRQLTEYEVWPSSIITSQRPLTEEILLETLRTGPYGRCVYYCDNDVVDHQVVTMEMENGITAELTMQGHSYLEGRTFRIDGSKATLLGKFSYAETFLEVVDHRTFQVNRVDFPLGIEEASGHGGGDFGLVRSFLQTMSGEIPPRSSARDSLESHLIVFAAEESRLGGRVVEMKGFREGAEV